MKRLTERIAPGYEYILIEGDGYTRDNAIDKLGRYEDTELEPEEIGKWIPVNIKVPKNDTLVLVCFDDGFITSVNYEGDWELWADAGEVTAWMPLPKPYLDENKKQRILNVWNNKEAAAVTYYDQETNTLRNGYHIAELKNLCEQEGIELNDYLNYVRGLKGEENE